MIYLKPVMGKDKKQFDERLQDVRQPKHDKVQYRKRLQQDKDAEKQLKDYENRTSERRIS
jgi:hypothetical protein